ncbi:MAG: hypothetical protein IJ343_07540 [Clostridia bacterium]|nr:hypothetical protein [Clostridia bacterium]
MRILMVNLPFAGHTNPTLPLAKALVQAGHEVTYVNAACMRERIEATGAAFVPYRGFPAHPTEEQKKRLSFRACFDTALALKGQADLLIYEMFFYPGFTLAQRLGVPCIRQWSQPAWSVEGWLNRPFRFRLSAQLLDGQIMSADDRAHMGQTDRSLSGASLNDKPALNIVYLPEEMQDCREDFGDEWVFLPPAAEAGGEPALLDYDALPRPLAYISLGSIISNRGFCREIIRAFGGKAASVILNTGRIDPASLGRIPANIHAFSGVPQVQVLSHADVFLTHCGMNSVNEAIACGVPMVAMPFVNDQPGNAARLVELGAAKRVRSFPSRGKRLYEAVCAVAGDAQMKRRLAELCRAARSQRDLEAVVRRVGAAVKTE